MSTAVVRLKLGVSKLPLYFLSVLTKAAEYLSSGSLDDGYPIAVG